MSADTITRETLLTPEMAAVLQAAKAMADLMRRTGWRGEFTVEYLAARERFLRLVAALREKEGA